MRGGGGVHVQYIVYHVSLPGRYLRHLCQRQKQNTPSLQYRVSVATAYGRHASDQR